VYDQTTAGPAIIRFDSFEVDLATGDVRRSGARVILQEQPLRILIRLLEARGKIVTRDDLRADLWPADTFVDFEHSLNAAIKRLRNALGDEADAPRFVETVPRRGYRFIAPISATPPTASPTRWKRFAATAAAVVVATALAAMTWRAIGRPAHRGPGLSVTVPAAYGPYMQGLVASRRWQAGECPNAERYLLEAIAIDPGLADAYAHLAFCYVFPDRMQRPGWETGPKARAAVARALALDPRSSFAHVVAGALALHQDFDWAAAEREFLRAIALDPREPQAQIAYGELLYASGRGERGLDTMRDALAIDPLDMNHQVAFGFALRNAGRFEEAAIQLRRILESDPEWTSAQFWLAYTEFDRGRHDAAVAEYLAFLERVVVADRLDGVVDSLRNAYRRGGWRGFWRRELEWAEEDNRASGTVWRRPGSYYAGPFSMARRYARLGETQAALDWLEKALAYRHHLMVFIALEPLFRPLRPEPRFIALRKRVGA
jgi:DNA-binding winged helix-turn-helix (wHTH) protein/Tfp pilus assembly protein PilF